MKNVNSSIRGLAKSKGVFLWQIGDHLGVTEPTMTRWMRRPLPPEKEAAIAAAIEAIAGGSDHEN